MIYGNNNSVKLYGEVADNFLESVGVSIFDDGDIAIGESIFDPDTGCDILEESGIVLCEDCIVLEGKQAEEYKARKAKEKADREDAEDARNTRRYALSGSKGDMFRFGTPAGTKKAYNSFFKKDSFYKGNGDRSEYILTDKNDSDRGEKARSIVDNEKNKRYREYEKAYTRYDNFDRLSSAQRKNDNEHARNTKGIIAGRTANKTRNNNRDALKNRYRKYSKDLDKARDHYDRIQSNRFEALDAANRHIRRHPDQYKESTIFSNIEII